MIELKNEIIKRFGLAENNGIELKGNLKEIEKKYNWEKTGEYTIDIIPNILIIEFSTKTKNYLLAEIGFQEYFLFENK